MPIYEYQCEMCGESCDLIQKFSDEPTKECPSCGKEGLIRKISAPSFHLKGTGWYVTDFKNPAKPSSDNKAENKPADTKADSKTENKQESSSTQSTKESESSSKSETKVAPKNSET